MTLAEKVIERERIKYEKSASEILAQVNEAAEKIANSMTTLFKTISEKELDEMCPKNKRPMLIQTLENEGFEVTSEQRKCGWFGKKKTFYRISAVKTKNI